MSTPVKTGTAAKVGLAAGKALARGRKALKAPTQEEARLTKKQRGLVAAKELHRDWEIDNGSGGDIISDMAYRAHVMQLLRLMQLDENLVIEATQTRKQCGLEPLDVIKLAFGGTIRERVEQSRDEVAEKCIQNRADAEKEALKKRQRNAHRL